MSKVTSVKFDDKTADLLDELKQYYGATSKAEVLRKAVALLSLASAADNEDARILIVGRDENGADYEREVIVR